MWVILKSAGGSHSFTSHYVDDKKIGHPHRLTNKFALHISASVKLAEDLEKFLNAAEGDDILEIVKNIVKQRDDLENYLLCTEIFGDDFGDLSGISTVADTNEKKYASAYRPVV